MFLAANSMSDERQFFNGNTGQIEVTLEQVIYHDTIPPTENGWAVWDRDWNGNAKHFISYREARALYEERVALRLN